MKSRKVSEHSKTMSSLSIKILLHTDVLCGLHSAHCMLTVSFPQSFYISAWYRQGLFINLQQ